MERWFTYLLKIISVAEPENVIAVPDLVKKFCSGSGSSKKGPVPGGSFSATLKIIDKFAFQKNVFFLC